MSTVPVFQWSSASLSDVGMRREVNEDACLERPGLGLWAVADGMGGHNAGDLASRLIVEALAEVRMRPRLEDLVDSVRERLCAVNGRLVEMAGNGPEAATIGSTVAVLVAYRRWCACVWAGDSRVYRYQVGSLERLTRDHSEVEDMIDRGEISPEEAEFHPYANVITRAVGGGEELLLDVQVMELQDGDRYLLCTDGLYKELSEADIAAVLDQSDCARACRTLVDMTLERGARDNVSVIVVQFEESL